MISHIEVFLRSLRRKVSRSYWAISLLRLSRLKENAQAPGLVMVQIDGLSKYQFSKSLDKKRMPFMDQLLHKEKYVLHSFYSGLPSNTPAVQAELFYGIKGVVPSFSFIDRQLSQEVKMFDASYVEEFEKHLKTQGKGLLSGGSSYSNIYTGDAKEAHFCWAQLGWSGVLHAVNPLVFPFLVILYADIFIRTCILLIIEFFIAFFECIRGTWKGRIFSEELRFVWLRVLVCVFLRELMVAGVCIDIMRGLPIIHLNFLGYDEQAHCRGPSSRYAHWSLRGIDGAIKRINNVIKQSPYRQYDLWIYSDHGQSRTTPYFIKHKRTIEEAVQELFGSKDIQFDLSLINSHKSRARLLKKNNKIQQKESIRPVNFQGHQAIVTAMGPLGQIYTKAKLEEHELAYFSQKLVSQLEIPLVMRRHQQQQVIAYTKRGSFILPQQAGEVFGEDHPFLAEFKEDVIRMCWHANAGEFVIAGWSQGEEAISFPLEYGAHAAMNTEETSAFALLPLDAPIRMAGKDYFRPIDLREAAQRYLNKQTMSSLLLRQEGLLKTFRLMSYNTHGCKGMDGHISTERIARVIARHKPDIIALQELDSSRKRSYGIDQAAKIADYLEMKYHFHPIFIRGGESYGNAILSRFPLKVIKMEGLPKLRNKERYEPRGALWVCLEFQGRSINIVNTHLSIWPQERMIQVDALLSNQWLEQNNENQPLVLCGDFNAMPGSSAYKKICKQFKDSQSLLAGHRPYRTWFGRYPVTQIDHIFVNSQLNVHGVFVPSTDLDQVASDHLPFIVDLSLQD